MKNRIMLYVASDHTDTYRYFQKNRAGIMNKIIRDLKS